MRFTVRDHIIDMKNRYYRWSVIDLLTASDIGFKSRDSARYAAKVLNMINEKDKK